jgi:glycosyltransferase involved in cell wall biosynthesis
MKIALVHDQLQEFGGAERVLVALKKIFPKADVFTSFVNVDSLKKHVPDYESWNIKTSWVAHLPFFGKLYSPLRFLTPLIWESFDFTGYDLIISSSGWYMCKGIITKKPTVHITYLHHPPRYLYGYETAVQWQKYWPVRIYAHIINHRLRIWDFSTSSRPDYFVVNSKETRRRVQKFYRRDATVIYPPVNIPKTWKAQPKTGDYYLTVSRLAKAKHIEVLIQAANQLKFKLKIVGNGRDKEYLQSVAGPTVEFLENVPDRDLPKLYQGAKAFLFASVDEEFGIAPIEAMGYGVPVIAYKSGGLVETVKDGVNGFLFEKLIPESLASTIKQFESLSSDQQLVMRKNARAASVNYSEEKFKSRILKFINARVTRG